MKNRKLWTGIIAAIMATILIAAITIITVNASGKENGTKDNEKARPWIGDDPLASDFIKENMPDVTYFINGRSIIFSYVKSAVTESNGEFNLDNESGRSVTDYYNSPEGYTITKNEGSDEWGGFYTNDYSEVGGTDILSNDEVIESAKEYASNSDIPFAGVEETVSARVDTAGSSVYVYLEYPSGMIIERLDNAGGLRSIAVLRYSKVSEERKEAAREKMRAKIKQLEAEHPGSRYEISTEEFVSIGGKDSARFLVSYYPNKDDEAHSAYTYYCSL